jgi:hypothetical protein
LATAEPPTTTFALTREGGHGRLGGVLVDGPGAQRAHDEHLAPVARDRGRPDHPRHALHARETLLDRGDLRLRRRGTNAQRGLDEQHDPGRRLHARRPLQQSGGDLRIRAPRRKAAGALQRTRERATDHAGDDDEQQNDAQRPAWTAADAGGDQGEHER